MNAGLKATGLTGSMYWNYWATHYSWIAAQGGNTFDDFGKFVGNADLNSVKAVDDLAKNFQTKTFLVAETLLSGAAAGSLFLTHKAGFSIQGRYTIGTVKQAGDTANYEVTRWPSPDGTATPTGVAASYLAINNKTKNKDAALKFWTEFLSVDGQVFRLPGGRNAVPPIKGAEQVVLEGNYPAHAQTLLDMRDTGFVDPVSDARVPGLSNDVSEKFLALYQDKASAQTTLDEVAGMYAKKNGQ